MGMIADLWIKLGLKNEAFNKGIDDSKNKLNFFSSSLKKLGGMIGGIFAVSSIVGFVKESQRLAAETENVRKAFIRMGGGSYFKELNEATRGTLSQVELMKNTIQASNFGIPIKNLGNLFKFATERAAQTGQSVEYLTQSIVMGIGRKSVLILDNLGISAVQLREKLKKVGEEAATVGDVAEAIGSIAEEQFKRMGEQASTTAQKLDDVKGSWNDIKVAIGDAINQNDLFVGGVKLLGDYLNVFSKQAENAMTNAGGRVKRFMSGLGKDMNTEGQKEAIKKELESINNEILQYEAGLKSNPKLAWSIFPTPERDKVQQEIATLKNQAIELSGIFDTIKVKQSPVSAEQRIKDLEFAITVEKKLAKQKGQTAEEVMTHYNAIKKAEEEIADLRKAMGQDPKDNEYVKLLEEIRKKQQNLLNLPKGTIAYYEAEIELLKAKHQLITDPQLLAHSQSEIDVKKDMLDQLTGELKLLENKKAKLKDIRDLVYMKENPNDRKGADKLDMGGSMNYGINNSTATSEAYNKQIADAKNFVDSLNDTLESGIEDSIITMSEGIGQMLSGDMGWEEFGDSILQTIGAFMVQFGSLLIAYGIASDAFKKAFSNPFVAIAAGVALVAIGSAISGMGSKGPSSSSGGGYSGASGYSPSGSQSAIPVEVGGSFELEGTKLKAVIHNTERKNNLIR